ncbi:UBN2 domain-containing protein [Cephalotus follicularis]|uniref:UBN2 domain-containing protein n=1 Tax=Cephalotus follicularis TaxID=3775 RepID=A0A1Q3D7C6_CEPFO|nr:UBN2 domain-containing protein [Cephalotus follicularis]
MNLIEYLLVFRPKTCGIEVTYEGTNQVKEAKINMLVHEYEMFTMHDNEDIKTMFTRFTNITNALQALGKIYTNSEMVRKILRLKKKKAMIATWEDSDDSSSDEEANEEVAQLALMAIEAEEDCDEVTYDELVLLVEKYTCIISELKKKIKCLNIENKELKSASISLIDKEDKNKIEILEENKNLKIEIDALKKTFSKFSSSSEKLEKLLGIQRCVFDKAGLGYDEMNNVKHYQNFFDRKNKIEKEKIEKDFIKKKNSFISCNYCGKNGHISSSCFYKNHFMSRSQLKIKKVWVPKGTIITNPPCHTPFFGSITLDKHIW